MGWWGRSTASGLVRPTQHRVIQAPIKPGINLHKRLVTAIDGESGRLNVDDVDVEALPQYQHDKSIEARGQSHLAFSASVLQPYKIAVT
jgi:hypothetical protein